MNIEKVKDHTPLLTHPAAKLTFVLGTVSQTHLEESCGSSQYGPPLLVWQSLRDSCSKTERVGEEPVTGWGGGGG